MLGISYKRVGVRLGAVAVKAVRVPTWGFSCRSRSGIIDNMPADRTASMRSLPPLVMWYNTHLLSEARRLRGANTGQDGRAER